MSINYNAQNVKKAQALRRNATPQEKRLWYDFLAKYYVRFQRQKAIDNFIVDFYCHKAKLVVEIDGSQHYSDQGEQNDKLRTEILEGYDLKVIRFSNLDILDNFQGVCERIDEIVKERLLSASIFEGGGTAKP